MSADSVTSTYSVGITYVELKLFRVNSTFSLTIQTAGQACGKPGVIARGITKIEGVIGF